MSFARPVVRLPYLLAPGAFLVLAMLATAGPARAQSEPDSTATLPLAELSCADLKLVFYREIPREVYDDRPDDLYEMVLYIDDRCDLGEPVGRIRILASIWDGNFSEAIYGYEVIDWLLDRYDPAKRPDSGSPAESFDDFTTGFADQLLPHVAAGSLEEFFCLYYSGRREAAWALLQGEALADSWLRYYYDEETDRLERAGTPYTVSAHWGGWTPHGDQGLVGPRQMVGVAVEQRWTRWFARLQVAVRLGRSDAPYLVSRQGITARSDRWNGFLLGADVGLTLWRRGPHLADVFAGLGLDSVTPFRDEDFALTGLNVSVGASYRYRLGASRRWFLGAGGRLEWVSDRNGGGTPLGGMALSGSLGLGFRLGRDPGPRLQALGRTR